MARVCIHVLSLAPMSTTQRQRLENLGRVSYWDAILQDPHEADKCREADILILTPRLHQNVIEVLDHCRLISVQAVGIDCLDIFAATRKGILVCNVANASLTRVSVAEHAFALLLALARKLPAGAALLQSGAWRVGVAYQPVGLAGKTVGIVGWGEIGQRIASLAQGFGMDVLVWTTHPEKYRDSYPHIVFVEFHSLLETSDFVILAAPATPATRGMISSATLARMKRTALLINVARGGLVVEEDLVEALKGGTIAGLGTDVYTHEPPPPDHPMFSLENVIATPHVAGSTPEAITHLLNQSIINVESFLAGRPINVVNPELLETNSGGSR